MIFWSVFLGSMLGTTIGLLTVVISLRAVEEVQNRWAERRARNARTGASRNANAEAEQTAVPRRRR